MSLIKPSFVTRIDVKRWSSLILSAFAAPTVQSLGHVSSPIWDLRTRTWSLPPTLGPRRPSGASAPATREMELAKSIWTDLLDEEYGHGTTNKRLKGSFFHWVLWGFFCFVFSQLNARPPIELAMPAGKGSFNVSMKDLHFFLGIVSASPIKFLFCCFCPVP